ncbi:ATP-binding protein [Amycolatopsis acidiphila]|uniref:ATP-binding protein n=1 Tax=Amycolatopsis acidiphila TaxID=715473 RepID=A0A558A5J0_9PSEU|nr:ATP-binding protein [Amycolatopsis acidiphila]TVT19522.1 ATP-binding protein [Amycolatopsis acidiphila]UIJ56884.1 ATP-binding protein [Amycolatopsis acidiphila]GHG54576.1 ATPase [Amycolatopsis acidiphila]
MSGNNSGEDAPALLLDLAPDHVPPLVEVRQWAARTLPPAGPDFVSDVQLVATELVSNAYEHAGGARRVRLGYDKDTGRLLVEVEDGSSDPPVRQEAGGFRGRGLALVDALAHAWGSRPRAGGGKTVWAVLMAGGR